MLRLRWTLNPFFFYNILQLKERVLVVAAAVCSDKGGWSTVSGDTFQIFREESRNASVVYGDAEEGKIIFGKFKDGFLFFINGKIMEVDLRSMLRAASMMTFRVVPVGLKYTSF